MKRLVFIIDNLSGGGAEQIVLTLAQTLLQMGTDAIIVTLSDTVEHEIPEHIKIIHVPEVKTRLGNIGRLKRHGKRLQQALEALNKEQPIDLLVSNLPRTDRIVKHTKGFKRCFVIHNTYSVEYLQRKKELSRWLKHRQLKNTYRDETIIAVSNGVLDDIKNTLKLPVKHAQTIYNPFVKEKLKALADQPPATDYGNYLIHVGRINRQKRHDRLLRVYRTSKLAGKVKLVLLGNGSDNEVAALKNSIEEMGLTDDILLHGFDKNPYPYIKNSKALLLTSDHEGLPTVLIEALICNTPVISTNCPSGPQEILTGELSRFLIETEDEVGFAKAINEIIAQPPVINEACVEKFSAEVIARQYIDLA